MAAAPKAPEVRGDEETSLCRTAQGATESCAETDREPPAQQQQRWRRLGAAVALLAAGSLVAAAASGRPDERGAAADPDALVSAEAKKCGAIWCDASSLCCAETLCCDAADVCCSKVVGGIPETVCEAPGVACPAFLGGEPVEANWTGEELMSTTDGGEDDSTKGHAARAFSPLTLSLSVSLLALVSRQSSLAA